LSIASAQGRHTVLILRWQVGFTVNANIEITQRRSDAFNLERFIIYNPGCFFLRTGLESAGLLLDFRPVREIGR